MAPLLALLLGSSLLGCFKPLEEQAVLDFTEVPYDAPVVSSTDARIRTYETGLSCPDGNGARFYLAYRTGLTEPVPAAILFHSGAFDYALQPDAEPTDELYGRTWRAESRLSRDFADRMAWETMGMYPGTVEESEVHAGAMVAALVDAGVPVLVPGNCWGDLWHNEEGFQDNDFALEAVARNGRTFAWWMVRMLYDDAFAEGQGVALPFEHDGTLHLVGLGDGGRAVAELLSHEGMRPVASVLVDSSPDTLGAWTDAAGLGEVQEGLRRIFAGDAYDRVDEWSVLAALQAQGVAGPDAPPDTGSPDTGSSDTGGSTGDGGTGDSGDGGTDDGGTDDSGAGDGGTTPPASLTYVQPDRIAWLWSSADPRQPRGSTEPTADWLGDRQGPSIYVADARVRAHVFSNRDREAAGAVADFLLGGDVPSLDWPQVVERSEPAEPADTGSGGETAE